MIKIVYRVDQFAITPVLSIEKKGYWNSLTEFLLRTWEVHSDPILMLSVMIKSIDLGYISAQNKWQGIALTSDDQDPQCHRVSLDHNELIMQQVKI